GEGDDRRAFDAATGYALTIGAIEKMSKSKRNTVDPSDIITSYGADTARLFMLSDSPPDRDVIWTEEGVAGAHRFVQRVWRIVSQWSAARESDSSAAATVAADHPLRRTAHRTLAAVGDGFASLRFNVAVAKIYELVNVLAAALPKAGDDPATAAAVDEAVHILVEIMAPIMPHLAEECWRALGHDDLLATRAWPTVEERLLQDDTLVLPVQFNGKKRGELTIAANASQVDVETAVLALDFVQRALDGRTPKKVVVVPKRIVNVVV
ncbi:MAG: class I tRNA ligase family protein, partial [Alphaproteobacteria bacterium]